MVQSRAPLHLGGPLGALGLGCVAGAVALAIMALNSEPLATDRQAEAALPVDVPPPPASAAKIGDSPTGPLGASRPRGAGPDDPDARLLQAQGGLEDVPQRPARAEGTEVFFIVRLKGAPEIDVITRNFKRDPAAAEAAWKDLVQRVPVLSEFTLAGASYSGEIKLGYIIPPGAPATPEDIRSVQERILGVEGVSYADPDYIAHPGKDTTP